MICFPHIALHVPTMLLPRRGVDLMRWAVIACDQYTSHPEYWERVCSLVGASPSTMNLILPEVYLERADRDRMISGIHETMQAYCDQGILVPQRPGFILVDRTTAQGATRTGLLVALDLEQYEYDALSRSLIRPTEGTILERLPPRVRVRDRAPVELSHIMVLINDPDRTVIEPLRAQPLEKVYESQLMMQAGRVAGYLVDAPALIRQVADSLTRLAGQAADRSPGAPLLYAVGDGNHSFATAKMIWERLKREAGAGFDRDGHPARYCLAELINVHDSGLSFEPIHRVVFNANPDDLLAHAGAFFRAAQARCRVVTCASHQELRSAAARLWQEGEQAIAFLAADRCGLLMIEDRPGELAVGSLQSLLDDYQAGCPAARIDYIHGSASLFELGAQPGNIGLHLPPISRQQLFSAILRAGALPRKTFSLGEADDKRFYLEGRRIVA